MKIVIYGNPKTKKNSSQIIKVGNRTMLIPSKAYREYEKLFISQCKYENRGIIPKTPINSEICLKCVYYRGDKRRVDLVNLLNATNDILVKAKIIEDDNSNIVVSHDGSRVLYDKENPRVEIEIDKIN